MTQPALYSQTEKDKAYHPLLSPSKKDTENIPSEDLFKRFVIDLTQNAPLIDDHLVARRVLNSFVALIALSVKVPFIPIAMKLGPILGPFSAAGNIGSFFLFEFWAGSGVVQDFFRPQTKSEKALLQQSRGKNNLCKEIVIISVASLIGMSAQLPGTFAGVKYNKEAYKIPAAIILLLAGTIIPIRSLQLSIEEVRKKMQHSIESDMIKIKNTMVALIGNAHQSFIHQSFQEKMTFIENIRQFRDLKDVDSFLLSFIREGPKKPQTTSQRRVQALFQYTGIVTGVAFAALFEWALVQYAFCLSKEELYDNDATATVFATLTAGSTVYLYALSIIHTAKRVFTVLGNCLSRNRQKNLAFQLRPKLSFALTSLGLLTNLLGLGPVYVVWGDFYNKNTLQHTLGEVVMCGAAFLLLFTSTLDIIDQIVTSSIKKGSKEELEILQIHKEFLQLANILQKAPGPFIKHLMENTPPTIQHEILERLNLTKENLKKWSSNSISLQEQTALK